MTIGLTEEELRQQRAENELRQQVQDELTKKERMRFLQGAFFGASLSICGHSRAEIVERFVTVAAAWGITQSEFESSYDEMMEQMLAVEREQMMH